MTAASSPPAPARGGRDVRGDDEVGAIAYGTPRGRGLLGATVTGSALAMLDGTIVNVALPAIGEELDAAMSGLQWVVSGYLLTLSALILVAGSLGDRIGRRRVFLVGVVWFAVASLACGLAPTLEVLVVARVLQGVGGALLTPGSLALIQASFRPEDRGRAIGAWSALGGVAAAIGPFVGGWLVQAASWRWAFLLNLPVAAAVVWLSVRYVPESRDEGAAARTDVLGAVLATGALAAATWGMIALPEQGATVPVVAALVVGGLGAAAFVLVESRLAEPMLPPAIFASRQFTGANLVTLVVYAALGGTIFLLVLQLQQSMGYGPVAAGVALLPVTVLMLLLSPRAGALAQRIGPRVPMTVGPLGIAAGLVLLAGAGEGDAYATAVLPGLVVFGLGLALTVAPLTTTVLAAAPVEQAGVASAINNAVARVAGLLAVALLPAVGGITGDDYLDPLAFTAGYRTGTLVGAGLALAGAILAWLTIRNDGTAEVPRAAGSLADAAAPVGDGGRRHPAVAPRERRRRRP